MGMVLCVETIRLVRQVLMLLMVLEVHLPVS